MIRRLANSLLFLLLFLTNGYGQTAYRYLIQLKDKNDSPYSVDRPIEFLSQKAIDRRVKNQIKIIEEDLPVSPSSITAIKNLGIEVLYPLKWVNGLVIKASSSELNQVLNLSFVKGLGFAFPLDSAIITSGNSKILHPSRQLNLLNYGNSKEFIEQIRLDSMHAEGFKGEGVLVAILDEGFNGMEINEGYFKNIQEKISDSLITYPEFHSIFNTSGSHGTSVFSFMGVNQSNDYIGGLFEAKYALAQTEEGMHELGIEEVNWMRGAEWADSLGADLINSSLGYFNFDNPIYDHQYDQLDGKTAFSSIAAKIASSKGIIIVNSAGNSGNSANKFISAPADAENILAVGATNRFGQKASFSSFGPTVDGRIKPDVAALGSAVPAVREWNLVRAGSGTSFSSPIIACLAGGLIQAFPWAKANQVMEAIRLSGNLSKTPNNELGYGIPNWLDAKKILKEIAVMSTKDFGIGLKVYPNPAKINSMVYIEKDILIPLEIEIRDLWGRLVKKEDFSENKKGILLSGLVPGKYLIICKERGFSQVLPLVIF